MAMSVAAPQRGLVYSSAAALDDEDGDQSWQLSSAEAAGGGP